MPRMASCCTAWDWHESNAVPDLSVEIVHIVPERVRFDYQRVTSKPCQNCSRELQYVGSKIRVAFGPSGPENGT